MTRGVANFGRMVAAGAIALALVAAAEACPGCKDALAGDEGGAGLAQGFGWSILFMMSMPFLILGGLGGRLYLLVRRARKQAIQAGTPAKRLEPGSRIEGSALESTRL